MSKHVTNQAVASTDTDFTAATDIAHEIGGSLAVTHVGNGVDDVSMVGNLSIGDQFSAIEPPAGGMITENSFYDLGDNNPILTAQENASSGANFTSLSDATHDQSPLSQYVSYDNLGDLSGDHLTNIFDNVSVGPAGSFGNSAANWSHGASTDIGDANAGGLLDVISDAHGTNTTHGGHGGGGGGGTPSPTPSPTAFTINVTYDASVGNAPSGFTTVVNQVVSFIESHFSDPVNVNINVGYGEVGGQTLGAGALGESITYLVSESYSTIVNALKADATSSFDQSAVGSLSSTDPTGSGSWVVSTAEAKALGLMSGGGTSLDGYVGFSKTAGFDYNNTDGVSSGTYDFFGVVAHEFSEVMGRILMIAGSSGYNSLFELFHYSAPGVLDLSGTTPGYFSVDGGNTNLSTFNTNTGGDFGDWAGKTVDAFNAFASSGVVLPISNADLTAMDAIGWNSTATTTYSGTSSTSSITMAQLENQHAPA